ncbi:MAG: alpha-hydroxy acid oxidase [Planctomycetota bacterium]
MGVLDSLRSVLRLRPIEWNRVERRLRRAANVGDLRRIARRRLPRGVFDYVDGAAEDEISLARNERSFDQIEFCPRVLRDVGKVDLSTTLLGRRLPLPLILAPTGFTRIVTSAGELAVGRAAARAGLPFALSTLGTRSIEEVAAVSDGDKWFQVYVWRDRVLLAEMLGRAKASGYSTLVITIDAAVLGRRERDVRRGFSLPPKIGWGTVLDGALHPSWTWDFIRSEPILFANVAGKSVGDGRDPISLSSYIQEQFDPALSWGDIEWFRERWDGPIVLKGIQSVADAVRAAERGIDAIALSNHGGRQLDGAPPPIELVAPVARAVGDRLELICDGGIRRGSDIVKAVALGARACMIGRAYLYGLGAAGERGVDWVLDHLADGVCRTLALTGQRGIAELDDTLVRWRVPRTE